MTQNKKASKRSSDAQTKIRTMRQGQQKIKLDIKKPSPSLPPLPLPFPPTQKVEQIVTKLVAKPRLARFPNAFIMYRNEYVLFLKSKNYHISMTELSPMISTSWKKEPEYVKETYTKLSSDAEKMYVRETGNTQPQINYKYLPTQRPTLKEYSSKLEPEISVPKLNETHQPQLNASNYDFFNDFNIYDRLLQSFSISAPNAFQRNFTKEPPVNGGDITPFSMGTTSELAKYSLEHSSLSSAKIDNPIVHQDNCFATDPNFFPWTQNISPSIHDDLSNIRSPTHLPQTPHCYSPSYSPTSPLEDLMNSPGLIGLDSQILESMESMSPCSTSSSPSDASSFDDISSLLFSSELDENRFFEKAGFAAPAYPTESINAQTSLQSSDLYHLYSGQSFATPSTVFNDKI